MLNSDALITFAYYCSLFCLTFVGYILIFEENPNKDRYKSPDWYYLLKRLLAIPTINQLKRKLRKAQTEQPKRLNSSGKTDALTVYGVDQDGSACFVKVILREHRVAEVALLLRLGDGKSYTFPDERQVRVCSTTGGGQWRAGGLTLSILEPFQRIRLTYFGFLRVFEKGLPGDVEAVKLSLMWNGADEVLHYPQDADSGLLSDALAKERWRDGSWIELMGDERGYEQYGAFQGAFTTPTVSSDLRFQGFRKRLWGTAEHLSLHRDFTIFVSGRDGTAFTIGARSYKAGCARLKFGTLFARSTGSRPITQHDINLEYVGEYSTPSSISFHVKAGGRTYKCIATLMHRDMVTMGSEGWETRMVPCRIILDGTSGVGLVSFWYSQQGGERDAPDFLLTEPKLDRVPSFVAAFGERECEVGAFAGEKGKLLALASSIISPNFAIPRGFVVLTTAFTHHLNHSEKLSEAVGNVKDVCLGNAAGDLSLACQRVVELFLTEPIAEDVAGEVLEKLGDDQGTWTVCISDASDGACGMEVRPEGVLQAVATCWSSIFNYANVTNRKRQGLEICPSAAVVLYRLGDVEKSGTVTSCEPSKVIIRTSRDEIVLDHTWKGELSLTSPASESLHALSLGRAAIEIEKALGEFCHLNWAYVNGVFYITQLITIDQSQEWTDEELLHEFDSPTITMGAQSTSANISELLPGALTPLTNSIVLKIFADYIYRPFGRNLIGSSLFQARIATDSLIEEENLGKFGRIWHVAKTLIGTTVDVKLPVRPPVADGLLAIENEMERIREMGKVHLQVSTQAVAQTKALTILTDPDPNSKLSLLLPLSVHQEISELMAGLAEIINESGLYAEFARVEPRDGMSWLKWNCPSVSETLEDLPAREYELQNRREDGAVLIEMLQFYCKLAKAQPSSARRTRSSANSRLVRFFTMKCKESIVTRERMRLGILKGIGEIRAGLRALSRELVRQGKIPEEDLIFYLSWYELKRLVLKQDGAAVPRAIRRKGLYPLWDRIVLPTTTRGTPKGVGDAKGKVMRTGESVFNGDVHGRACVVRAVHDIRHLEQGDVLITSSVNLSWSPYFAMLSGLVTEASGVLSYGATLAKDFEVPCVVGVENATLIFETGDMVLLSGKNGTVQLSS
ncbi:uncharacterized protein LOC116161707 isoform X2 [Photinus pyralis]|uniref:uncharacterized protein LOC116161707 isoform X2 n=1 Tax=Photinus pyralis TaxID=7054 RepID=UPI0012675702|nr:uncharacterized protein LOC116161707 isoform X2 [Photinus pyralis]